MLGKVCEKEETKKKNTRIGARAVKMKVARCWVKDEPLKRTMFKRNLTGQGRLRQKEARGGKGVAGENK